LSMYTKSVDNCFPLRRTTGGDMEIRLMDFDNAA